VNINLPCGQDRPVLFITLSNGWGIRNFVHTGLIARMAGYTRVVVYVSGFNLKAVKDYCRSLDAEVRELDIFSEPASWRLLRQLRKKLFQSIYKIKTEQIKEAKRRSGRIQSLMGRLVSYMGRFGFACSLLQVLEEIDFYINNSRRYENDFKFFRPRCLFIGSPFDYIDGAMVREAAKWGVPSVTMVPSWDNLTSKGMIWSGYERIFVWSEYQKKEILHYYPSYRPGQVLVTGIPQFDVYAQPLPPEFERSCYLSSLGIPVEKRILLYSTTAASMFPEEPQVIAHLAQAVLDGILPADLYILVRCHPQDDASRYTDITTYPNVKIWPPSRRPGEDIYRWAAPRDELLHLAAMLRHSAVCVNVSSTMTIDAAACDIPVINVCYDGDAGKPYLKSVRRYFDYTHYAPVVETGAAPLAHSRQELLQLVREALEAPERRQVNRQALLHQYCEYTPGGAAERLSSLLFEFMTDPGADESTGDSDG
jgi:hypothetical protein